MPEIFQIYLDRQKKPKRPLGRFLYEDDDGSKGCNICGSSLKRKFSFTSLFSKNGCINDRCQNYWKLSK